jgi:hypothetical protein
LNPNGIAPQRYNRNGCKQAPDNEPRRRFYGIGTVKICLYLPPFVKAAVFFFELLFLELRDVMTKEKVAEEREGQTQRAENYGEQKVVLVTRRYEH